MARIAIVGGGRWARVIAGVLAGGAGGSHRIAMYSPGAGAALQEWIAAEDLAACVDAVAGLPDAKALAGVEAAIVANAAADHSAAAMATLAAGVPTLVEKPMALGADDVAALIEAAERSAAILAASNVFLFARHIERFADGVRIHGGAREISLEWTDPRGEIRYGDKKTYDASISVLEDVLPHATAILRCIGDGDFAPGAVGVARGGAEVLITAPLGDIPYSLLLARDAGERRRAITANTAGGKVRLDFSAEPGVLVTPDGKASGDPDWAAKPRPLAAMLTAFLDAATGGGKLDPRLSANHALVAARFSDAIAPEYIAQQATFFGGAAAGDEATIYAGREMAARASRGNA